MCVAQDQHRGAHCKATSVQGNFCAATTTQTCRPTPSTTHMSRTSTYPCVTSPPPSPPRNPPPPTTCVSAPLRQCRVPARSNARRAIRVSDNLRTHTSHHIQSHNSMGSESHADGARGALCQTPSWRLLVGHPTTQCYRTSLSLFVLQLLLQRDRCDMSVMQRCCCCSVTSVTCFHWSHFAVSMSEALLYVCLSLSHLTDLPCAEASTSDS